MDSEGSVHLEHLVRATLEPYAFPDRGDLTQAPEGALTEDQVVPVSLILHELATNAVKYGALLAPTGRPRIGWSVEDLEGKATCLDFAGQESGDPRPPLPTGWGLERG